MLNRYWITLAMFLGFLGFSWAGPPPSFEQWDIMGFRPVPKAVEVPDIRFIDESGEARSLSEFRGSVVLLNFWASWCPPCRAEMPSMDRLRRALEGTDFVMLPVNAGEKEETVKRFTREFDIEFPVYIDEKAAGAAGVGVSGLPTSLMIDREGRVLAAVNGSLEWDNPMIIEALGAWARP